MDFLDCPHLSLAPHWARENDRRRIVVVNAIDAIWPRRRGEYEAVEPWEAIRQIERRGHSMAREIDDFLSRSGGFDSELRWMRDDEVAALVVRGIERRKFVGLRRARARIATGTDPTLDERILVRDIERHTRGRLSQAGRQHKVVAGADLAGITDRDSYEVVRHDDAKRVLAALAQDSADQTELAGLFDKASAKLSPDWRPPLAPKGLVLLRRIASQRVAAASHEPAISPSQMRALMESSWIEIDFVDEQGEPVDVAYRVELSDGTVVDGEAGQEGNMSKTDIKPGTCKLTLPKLDKLRWKVG
jgi:hypothetical protein